MIKLRLVEINNLLMLILVLQEAGIQIWPTCSFHCSTQEHWNPLDFRPTETLASCSNIIIEMIGKDVAYGWSKPENANKWHKYSPFSMPFSNMANHSQHFPHHHPHHEIQIQPQNLPEYIACKVTHYQSLEGNKENQNIYHLSFSQQYM